MLRSIPLGSLGALLTTSALEQSISASSRGHPFRAGATTLWDRSRPMPAIQDCRLLMSQPYEPGLLRSPNPCVSPHFAKPRTREAARRHPAGHGSLTPASL